MSHMDRLPYIMLSSSVIWDETAKLGLVSITERDTTLIETAEFTKPEETDDFRMENPLLRASMMNDRVLSVGWIFGRLPAGEGDTPVPVPLCPPEISQGLVRGRTGHDEGLATRRLELLQGLYVNNWPCLFLSKLTVVQLLKFPAFCETK